MRCQSVLTGALLLLVPEVLTPEELVFGVPSGARIEKSFETEGELTVSERELLIDGNELEVDSGDVEVQILFRQKLVLVDEYTRVDATRPLVLLREFRLLEGREDTEIGGDDGDQSWGDDKHSPLEGKTVRFTWDEDQESYGVRYHGEERGDESLLEDLVGDSDLLAFLPQKPVAEGDSWRIEARHFRGLTDPGGILRFVGEDEEDGEDEGQGVEIERQLHANQAGTLTATYEGVRDEEGTRVAVIALRAEIRTHAVKEGEDEDGDPVVDRFELSSEYEGELLWDGALGRPHSYRIAGDLRASHTETTTWEDEDEGQTRVLVLRTVLSGASSHTGVWRSVD
jgi:hypothetical protein